MERYLTEDDVIALIPILTNQDLKTMRFLGTGPKFLSPTPRKRIYRESDVLAWLDATERTSTA